MEVLTEKECELTLLPVKHHSDNDGQIVTSPWQSRVHPRDLFTRKDCQPTGWKPRFGGGAICSDGNPPG